MSTPITQSAAIRTLVQNDYVARLSADGTRTILESGGKRYVFYISTGGGNALAPAGVPSAQVFINGISGPVKIRFGGL